MISWVRLSGGLFFGSHKQLYNNDRMISEKCAFVDWVYGVEEEVISTTTIESVMTMAMRSPSIFEFSVLYEVIISTLDDNLGETGLFVGYAEIISTWMTDRREFDVL